MIDILELRVTLLLTPIRNLPDLLTWSENRDQRNDVMTPKVVGL